MSRGPAKGYIEALEHRLQETESLLLKILSQLSDTQLSSIVSQDVTAARTRNDGLSPCAPLSPMGKKSVEHWKSFPLTAVENIRRWQQDCLSHTRPPALNEAETDIEAADSCPPATGRQGSESQAPNDTESAFKGNHSNSHELGSRPTPSVYGAKSDMRSGQSEGTVSQSISEVAASVPCDVVTQMSTSRREADRPFYMPSEAENSSSYGMFDTTSSSQSQSFQRNLAPKAPQELSSWIAAPPVKFQQQFLWEFQIELLEAGSKLDEQPRAAHYASPATYELMRAGVLNDVKQRGFHPRSVTWRKSDGTFIPSGTNEYLPDDYPYKLVVLPRDRLGVLLYEHIQRLGPIATVEFSHKVVKVGQDEDKAWVEVETPTGDRQRREADYVIGCDGASSTVRRELSGPEYPGETLDAQIIAMNVYYDFTKYNFWDSNFVVDPKNWYMAVKITKDGLYRVTYARGISQTTANAVWRDPTGESQTGRVPHHEHQPVQAAAAMRTFFQTAASAYRRHRRRRQPLRLPNGHPPWSCNEIILDKYSEVRKKIWTEIIDPMSWENFRRLHDQDPDKTRENDEFFKLCVKAETDEELTNQMALALDV
ncbi:hypothetical protein VTN00DRAFT_7760 [Thermoascus crustaceus]|uniref:uncharacterized protein n=1 Tax=Thermoascus crustaceus TaxID=5088 RepID=UPI003744170C